MAKKGVGRFKLRFLVDIYKCALEGWNDKTIAKLLGVTPAAFSQWKKKRGSVRYALHCGKRDRKEGKHNTNWSEYVRGKLPPRLVPVWNQITRYSREESGYAKVQLLLANKSRLVRQELLVYALLTSGFNLTKALRICAIERKTFVTWAETDRGFVDLLNEVQQIKKDFVEDHLLKLVGSGDSPATIFTSRTLNKDRGYGEKVEHTHSHMLAIANIPLMELNLGTDVLRRIVDAIKEKRDENERKALPVEAKVVEKGKA